LLVFTFLNLISYLYSRQCETDLRKNNLNHDPDTDQKVVEPSTSSGKFLFVQKFLWNSNDFLLLLGFVPVEEIQEILVETQLNNFEPLSARASPVQQVKDFATKIFLYSRLKNLC